uniref:NADH dehydrogenase subunit 3 n=1 Tax=Apanteles gelechiidivoris TaxID=1911542 RepID=UPI00286C6477|nr:NADH dehydrogenase subunit 3 [Apanteles gelechiidivoris]WKW91667.1 NADH dehydrogenase subunit 3 [Apanteles gelechiidivoris]WLN31485.1 NADH dehydrogenase subunit 3 [Apanteles gelechiidivoris]
MIYLILMLNMILFMIIFLLIMLNWMISKNLNLSLEKNSPFECGFEPFESSRLPFSIHFYLIAVLFLIFDVEIILLFPMMNSLKIINYMNWLYTSLMILLILYLGLEFEKNEGIMKWFI